MDFGVALLPHPPRAPPLAKRAEELGFSYACFPDALVYAARRSHRRTEVKHETRTRLDPNSGSSGI